MPDDVVLYGVDEHIATITINRPEAYNSLNYAAYEELTAAFDRANDDPEVRTIIFTGTGRGFCTCDDVKELLGAGAAELSRRIASGELELPSAPMRRSDKPIIAAVNGAAVGYGMELSLLADIRIGSETAKFSQMFVPSSKSVTPTTRVSELQESLVDAVVEDAGGEVLHGDVAAL